MEYIKKIKNSLSKNGVDLSFMDINCKNISILFVNVDEKKDDICMLDKSTIFYYIIEGTGKFEINGKVFEVKDKDLIEIPPQNYYTYEGKMKLLEINSNAFNENETHFFPRN